MSNKFMYPQVSAYGEVTNVAASNQVIAARTDMYLSVERITFSIYEQAEGGGGLFRIQGTEGTVVYTSDADTVKDLPIDFGPEGVELPISEGLEIIVYGAQTKQASVSIAVTAHRSFKQGR